MRASIAAATTGVAGLALGVGALAGAAALGYVQWQKWGQAGRDMAEQSGISTLREGIDGTAPSYSSMAAKARKLPPTCAQRPTRRRRRGTRTTAASSTRAPPPTSGSPKSPRTRPNG